MPRTTTSTWRLPSCTPDRARVLALVLPWLVSACATDGVVLAPDTASAFARSAAARTVSVCHMPGASPAILQVAGSALRAHLEHGDYLTTLSVSPDAEADEQGLRYARITDALSAARAGRLARGEETTAACRVTIDVAAGRYDGTATVATGALEQFPLMVDVPDITLRGALDMEIDPSGRATGASVHGAETVLASTERLPVIATVQTPLIIANAHPGGSAGHGLVIEGFVFVSGPRPETEIGGQGVLGIRVEQISVRRNRFAGGFSESIDLRASSGDVLENHLSGQGGSCDICLSAPGRYRAIGNRSIGGGIPGITTSAVVGLPVPAGVEPYVLPTEAEIWTEVRNNEVRDHLRVPVGVGIRVETVGTLAPNVRTTVHAVIQDNLIGNNRFGIIIHAGFPVNGALLTADADITLGGNIIENSCQTKVLVTMSRHQRSLGLNAVLPYLQNSTYHLTLNGDVPWDAVWFDHPAGRNNTLVVDGALIANGSRQFYSGASCPQL